MYQEGNIQAQLEKCYFDDSELQKSSFMKFGAKICQDIEKYGGFFMGIIDGPDCELRKRVLYLFNVMTTEEYLKFGSTFVDDVFLKLIEKAQEKGGEDEMALLCLMLTNYQMQTKYLNFLSSSFYEQYQQCPNFGVLVFERLMENILDIHQGKIKGPVIKQQNLNELFDRAFDYILSRTRQKYKRADDRKMFLSICCHLIRFKICFNQKKQVIPQIHNIWKIHISTFNADQSESVVNELFRLMDELFTLNDPNYMSEISEIYLDLLPISTEYGLQCCMVSKFWNTYIKKLGKVNDLNKVDSRNINLYGCLCLMKQTNSINQIGEKLKIIDNIVLMNGTKAQMHEYQIIKSKLYEVSNPEHDSSDRLFMFAIEALYSNLLKVEENKEFQNSIAYLKVASLEQNRQKEIYYSFVSYIPAMKILLLKCPSILEADQVLESLIFYLFSFLHDKETRHYFEDFISLLCKEVMKQFNNQFQRKISQRITKILQHCLNYLERNCKNIDVSSHVNCMQKLSSLVFDKKCKKHEFTKYLQLIKTRNRHYEDNIYQATSKIIKQMDLDPTQIEFCMEQLQKIVFQCGKPHYIELVFDFLEVYKRHPIVWSKIQKHDQFIKKSTKEYDIHQILRSLNCKVLMIQNDQRIEHCENVETSLSNIVQQRKFDSEIYKKIISVIQRQKSFLKNEKWMYQRKVIAIARNTIITLMKMLTIIEQTLEQNDNLTNSQKSAVYLDICVQIYNYTVILFDHPKYSEQRKVVYAEQIITNIKKIINSGNKFSGKSNYDEIEMAMKTASLLLQLKEQNQNGGRVNNKKPMSELRQLNYLLSICAKSKKKAIKTKSEKQMESNFSALLFQLYATAEFETIRVDYL